MSRTKTEDVTFEQACRLVEDRLRPDWGNGTFWVEPYGYDHDRFICIIYGSREWLVDHDRSFVRHADTHVFVSKKTGDLRWDCPLDTFEFFRDSIPVGVIPDFSRKAS